MVVHPCPTLSLKVTPGLKKWHTSRCEHIQPGRSNQYEAGSGDIGPNLIQGYMSESLNEQCRTHYQGYCVKTVRLDAMDKGMSKISHFHVRTSLLHGWPLSAISHTKIFLVNQTSPSNILFFLDFSAFYTSYFSNEFLSFLSF